MVAQVLSLSESTIEMCAKALKTGKLVAFPTETVFGLGANIWDESSLRKIYLAKQRPFTDPLIVHLYSVAQVKELTEMSEKQREIFCKLAQKFWPGPLTIIVNVSKKVSKIVTACSDFIGLRIPSDPNALCLLKTCGIPIAAPSANRFGHVSPTTAQHVYDDLGFVEDLYILDPLVACSIGIESTVLKIDKNGDIYVLRPGAVSSVEIENYLISQKIMSSITVVKNKAFKIKETITALDSPGQSLTHYSPDAETFILSNNNFSAIKFEKRFLQSSVLIDYKSARKDLSTASMCYLDLSPKGSIAEANSNLFSYLRVAEKVPGVKYILLPYISTDENIEGAAIFDRIFRAASGKFIEIL